MTPTPEPHREPAPEAKRPASSPAECLASFLDACGGAVRQAGNEQVFRCPCSERHANGDAHPSGNVRLGDDGRLLVVCRAGCATVDMLAAIGWQMSDLMPPGTPPGPRPRDAKAKTKRCYPDLETIAAAAARSKHGQFESAHVYRDASGAPVFGVVRIRRADNSKEIPQVRPDAGAWVFGGGGRNRPLYRLPELLAQGPEPPVLCFEGEQKADLAATLGFVATSCSQGAGNAKLTDFAPLAGRVVHLFADNDEKGESHMHDVAQRAYAAGAALVRNVTLPNLPPKGDIVDYCRARRSARATDVQIAVEIRDAIAKATEVDRKPIEAEAGPDPAPADDEAPTKIADQLVALASDATLFHDEHDEPYAAFLVKEHRETWRIGSEHFARWLNSRFYRTYKRAVPPAAMTTAIAQLTARAMFDGDRLPVCVRVARTDGGVWLDLCNESWQAIEITSHGWRVVDEPVVRFTRKPGMKALPTPATGFGNFDPLFDLLHFGDPQLRLLVTAWLVNCAIPATSYPILSLTGEQGSGKTTFSRAMQRLIDPHDLEGRSPPRNEEDIAVAAQHAHVLCYENLSGISPQLSDALCRVATGAGFAARKLYTDADERQMRFCRPIIINGIDDLATRSDLADRVIGVHLEPIPRELRRTEADLWAAFEGMHSRLLGTLLDLVVKVMATRDVDVPLERMAEYSRLGAKVAVALGLAPTTFTTAYRANRDVASQTALEASAVGPALLRMVRKAGFRGLISGLLQDLQQTASKYELRHPDWPSNPRALGGELRRLSPNLARVGITVQFLGHRRDGYWVAIEQVVGADGHDGHDSHEEARPE